MRLMMRNGMIVACAACLAMTAVATAVDAPKPATTTTQASETTPDPFAPPSWVRAATRPTSPAPKRQERPIEDVDHVVIISIDGCRPDLLLRGNTPNLHGLFGGGAFTFWARTTPNSITLPSHTSMLTGVDPRKHGIEWNRDLPLARPIYPNYPTIFYQAKRYGYRTGMAAGKSKFDFLTVPGTLNFESVPKKTGKDTDVAEAAAEMIVEEKPDLMFVHLPGTDSAGHKYGWGTDEQMEAIANADEAVGVVLAAVKKAGLTERTVVIVSADHGGAGKGHGPDDPRSRHIPWIVSGPGVRKNLDLTAKVDLQVRTEDTFATACWLLGIALDPKIDGVPVKAAFKLPPAPDAELLKDKK